MLRVAGSALALVLLSALPAGAHLAAPTDPNDTLGPLDIRRAYFSHGDGLIRIGARTGGDWAPSILGEDVRNNGLNDNAFEFQFDSRGNGYADYVVTVDWVDGELQAKLRRFVPFGEPTTETEFVSFARVQKDGHVIKVRFPRRRLQPSGSAIAWSADSYFRGASRCDADHWCIDRVPNRYLFVHQLD